MVLVDSKSKFPVHTNTCLLKITINIDHSFFFYVKNINRFFYFYEVLVFVQPYDKFGLIFFKGSNKICNSLFIYQFIIPTYHLHWYLTLSECQWLLFPSQIKLNTIYTVHFYIFDKNDLVSSWINIYAFICFTI